MSVEVQVRHPRLISAEHFSHWKICYIVRTSIDILIVTMILVATSATNSQQIFAWPTQSPAWLSPARKLPTIPSRYQSSRCTLLPELPRKESRSHQRGCRSLLVRHVLLTYNFDTDLSVAAEVAFNTPQRRHVEEMLARRPTMLGGSNSQNPASKFG